MSFSRPAVRGLSILASLGCAVALQAVAARADDWPQWMGPGRDNVWRETGIIDKFPEGGPQVLWRAPIAGGYAGPAVGAGRVVVTDYVTADNVKIGNFGRKEFAGTERIICLDEKTGKQLWKHEYPVRYSVSYPAGPRCTPNIHEGKVYTLGAEGHLFCFDLKTGDVIWSHWLTQEYQVKAALWGYAGHPLIDGRKLLCVVGGKGSHIVAFDKNTGNEIWRALTAREQGYSPPTIIKAGGKRQLILLRPDAVSSLDPETGKHYWSVPYTASNGSIIMSPVRSGNLLYVGGYSNKNMLLKLADDKPDAEIVWRDEPKSALSPVNVQPFVEGKLMYGFDQNGKLYGVDIASGQRLWESTGPIDGKRARGSGTAFLVKQADRFWMFNEQGELVIARLSKTGYTEVDRAKVIEPTNEAFNRDVVWCPPAYANRRVYVRNDNECICVDLAAPNKQK